MKRLSLVLLAVSLFAVPAMAAPIALTGPFAETYNQQDSPCFIGYSCGPNQGISMTTWTGSVPAQGIEFSPVYTGAELAKLLGLVGSTPLIAIDINQSGTVGSADSFYLLDYIKVYFNGDTSSPAFIYGPNATAYPQRETGNGDSDYVYRGLVLPSNLISLQFEVSWGNFSGTLGDNNDGKELFFLVKEGTPQVPEPATMLLLGTGLLGLGVASRRRRR